MKQLQLFEHQFVKKEETKQESQLFSILLYSFAFGIYRFLNCKKNIVDNLLYNAVNLIFLTRSSVMIIIMVAITVA